MSNPLAPFDPAVFSAVIFDCEGWDDRAEQSGPWTDNASPVSTWTNHTPPAPDWEGEE